MTTLMAQVTVTGIFLAFFSLGDQSVFKPGLPVSEKTGEGSPLITSS